MAVDPSTSGLRIEAFSAGKDPANQDANEDRLLVLPGRAYAVIDGVTDRTGTYYDGQSSGGIAAGLVQAALERTLASGSPPGLEPDALLALLTDEIAIAYNRLGLREQARVQPNLRFGATLALFRHRGAFDEVVLVGDSGIRLDGARVMQVDKALDTITAFLRVAAWRELAKRGADLATRTRIARQIVFHGAGQGAAALEGMFDALELDAIAARAVTDSMARFPHLPENAVAALIQGGIVHGQFQHQNSETSPLGYSGVDGFAIPMKHVTVTRIAPGITQRIELFSDGYFKHGEDFGVASWEAAADEVERIDPERIGPHASVKGSYADVRADDRTYVGIEPGALSSGRPAIDCAP